MFAFITHMQARPGQRDALIRLNRTMQDVTANEDGVPIYAFHTAEDSPDDFYYYDLYETQEAYDAHCATPEFKNMMTSFSEIAEIKGMTKLIPFGPLKSGPLKSSPLKSGPVKRAGAASD
jgi:quinol monooxygenase YgiN